MSAEPTTAASISDRPDPRQAEREVLTWDLYGQGVRELARGHRR